MRHLPWRASIAILAMLLVGPLGVVVALTTGLLLTDILGGLITWLWVGATGAALIGWWARLLARSDSPAGAPAAAPGGGTSGHGELETRGSARHEG